jgi:hypothetical protein
LAARDFCILSQSTWLAVRPHLALCRMSRTYRDRFGRAPSLLGGAALAPPAADVEERIMAAAETAPRR